MSDTAREEFRISRLKEMDRVSADLFGAIDEALKAGLVGKDFAEYIADPLYASFLAQYEAEGLSPFAIFDSPRKAWDWFYGRVRSGLEAVVESSEAKRIADWLGTATVNGAKVAGTESEGGKMWLSRRDAKVRPKHVEADGQVVPWGVPFIACGEEMAFPGEPVGDPECWLNCRCVAAPAVLPGPVTAAADPEATGKVIVAIPAQDDPIWNASSEPKPHMTMIWLGKQEFTPEQWGSILGGVKGAAMEFGAAEGPQELAVTSREPLGDDDADVLMLDPGPMTRLRDYMLTHETIKAAHDAVDQYPQWTPHLTLGYPTTPAKGEPGETIRFDRLAVWDGDYEGEEYPMSVAVEEDMPVVDEDEPISHGGNPDEDWSVEPVPWNGVLAPEGIPSGDGRRFAPGALEWRDLPIPLLWQKSNGMGHEGAVIVGQINNIWRDGNLLRGAGFFADTPEADEVIGLYAEGHARGVSVAVDSAEMAVEDEEAQSILFNKGRISAATLCAIPAFAEAYVVLGEWVEPEVDAMAAGLVTPEEFRVSVNSPTGPVTGGQDVPLPFVADVPLAVAASSETEAFKRGPGWVTDPVATKRIHDYWTKPGHEGYAKIGWGTPGDFRRLRAHLAKYIGPQFLNRTVAQWHHDALGYWPGEKGKPGNPMALGTPAPALHLVASGGWCAPSEWYEDPKLEGPTALTITDDGRVFGHLATWGTCHIGITGVCTEPPTSASDYAYFMTGVVRTAEGTDVHVGQITMGTGHASTARGVSARQAAAHYDNTGAAVADIRVGQDEYGIWMAGAMRPTATEQQRYELRAAGAVSGDWRDIGGSLELVAALGVNVPGFPIPRVALAASGDRQESLVAAGIVMPDSGDADDVADFVRAVADEVEARATRRARAAALLDDTRALRVAALKDKVEV